MNVKPTPRPIITRGNGTGIDRDPLKLHPLMRAAAEQVLSQCKAEALPFELFEGWRSPQRQASLWVQGRQANHPGPKITNAKPWESYHQYGLAGDFVLFMNNQWSWDAAGEYEHLWMRLAEIGEIYDLEPLTFEKPHLQIARLELADLKAGKYPGGSDPGWEQNLQASLEAFPINTIVT